jgi:hypothetical protein
MKFFHSKSTENIYDFTGNVFHVVTSQHRNYLQALVHNLNLQCMLILQLMSIRCHCIYYSHADRYIKQKMHDKISNISDLEVFSYLKDSIKLDNAM